MRYSLLSKFQGALLGAALGNLIGIQVRSQISGTRMGFDRRSSSEKSADGSRSLLKTEPSGFPFGNRSPHPQVTGGDVGGRLALLGARSLIRCQGLNIKDWHATWSEIFPSQLPLVRAQEEAQSKEPDLERHRRETATPSAVRSDPFPPNGLSLPDGFPALHPVDPIVAALPITLLLHENKVKLRETVEELVTHWTTLNLCSLNSEELTAGLLAVGYGIAQACKEKLDPHTLIGRITTYLEVDTSFVALLLQVQILLDQGASLETATTHLRRTATAPPDGQQPAESRLEASSKTAISSLLPVVLAFYCFLSTPEDFKLAVLRAARSGLEPAFTCTLTGALSGAYNSRASLPPEWYLTTKAVSSPGVPLEPTLWGAQADTEILELAASLLAVWSGVYDGLNFPDLERMPPVVAAPYSLGRQRL